MITLKIYLNNGDKELIEVKDKKQGFELMKKYNLKKSEVLFLDENLEEIYI